MTAVNCTRRSLTASVQTAEKIKTGTATPDNTPEDVRAMLREIAFVLHATRAVKRLPKIRVAEAD